ATLLLQEDVVSQDGQLGPGREGSLEFTIIYGGPLDLPGKVAHEYNLRLSADLPAASSWSAALNGERDCVVQVELLHIASARPLRVLSVELADASGPAPFELVALARMIFQPALVSEGSMIPGRDPRSLVHRSVAGPPNVGDGPASGQRYAIHAPLAEGSPDQRAQPAHSLENGWQARQGRRH